MEAQKYLSGVWGKEQPALAVVLVAPHRHSTKLGNGRSRSVSSMLSLLLGRLPQRQRYMGDNATAGGGEEYSNGQEYACIHEIVILP